MLLASLPLAGTWHSLRNLVLSNEDAAIKSFFSTQWYQEEKEMVCLNVSSKPLFLPPYKKKILPLPTSIPNNYTPPPYCWLLTSWSSRPLDPWSQCALHSRSDLLPGHDLLYPSIFPPLLVFFFYRFILQLHWHFQPLDIPPPIILLPISPPLESLFSLTTLTITTLLPIF